MSQAPASVNSSYCARVGELLTIAIAMALTLPFTSAVFAQDANLTIGLS